MFRYAITDGRLSFAYRNSAAHKLAARCGELARDGVDFVLLREKRLAAGELADFGRMVLQAVREANATTKVLLAQRLDVALAIAADGVNLAGNSGELTPRHVRRLMPEGFVSVSCHSVADVVRARDAGASAVLFGPVFGKTVSGVEVVPGVGLDALREACLAAEEMSVFALGGVTEATASRCVKAGAVGVAAIRMFFESNLTL